MVGIENREEKMSYSRAAQGIGKKRNTNGGLEKGCTGE